MCTEIRYDVTHIENIPASIWGRAINREITQKQVKVENIKNFKNIVRIKPVPSITYDDVTQGGKFGCE